MIDERMMSVHLMSVRIRNIIFRIFFIFFCLVLVETYMLHICCTTERDRGDGLDDRDDSS